MTNLNYLVDLTVQFAKKISALNFSFDGYVYNPLVYAWKNHEQYLLQYVKQNVDVLFLGMNPGPFGMLQTGIPFGEVNAVKDYLRINNLVGKPEKQHPSRPVLGMVVGRSEISGFRFWGLMKKHYPDASDFAKNVCVMNYCPLGFLSSEKGAKNITPDKLLKEDRLVLENVCNKYLNQVVEFVQPKVLVGVGKYAEERLKKNFVDKEVFRIIHPSPGNPQANKNWEEKTENYLKEVGIWK